jgi:hypothetical protein
MNMNSTKLDSHEISTEGKSVTDDSGQDLQLHVLLLYEDLETGLRARLLFDQTMSQLGFKLDYDLVPWRAEILRHPHFFNEATRELEKTDILLISTHGNEAWPLSIWQYFLLWLSDRGRNPSALVVSFDSRAMCIPATANALDTVRLAADLSGVSFFLHAGNAIQHR